MSFYSLSLENVLIMTPIKVIFKSGNTITAYSADPDSFAQTVADVSPPEITGLDYGKWVDSTKLVPELQEVKISLKSGAVLMCEIPKEDLDKLRLVDEIEDYSESTTIQYARLMNAEAELDKKFGAVTAVINNLPNLEVRLHLHRQYMKRKAAYIAALEALVDSVIRRPEQ